ncbi:MAG: tetratricopeptide repeat protein [Planctomycetes bacterium]|nr:tetratricopeptide repeat protein [Planctomycetota bacterium]
MTPSTTPIGARVGRARRGVGQLWQVPTFLFGLLAVLGVAASSPWRQTPQWREFDGLISSLRVGLDKGEPTDSLVGLAEQIHAHMAAFPGRKAEAHFLIGSALYQQARANPASTAHDIWPRAMDHLEQAFTLGVREHDRPALHYRLGYCWYQQKTNVPRALELMTQSVDKGARQPLEGYRLLIEAYLQQQPVNLDAALAACRRVLDLTPSKDADAQARARLQISQVLLRKGQRADANKELARIGAKAPRAIRLQARLLQAQAYEEDNQWTEAITIWRGLLADAPHVEGGRVRICYALGKCLQQKEPPDNAETMRVWADALRLGGPAGQAAGLRLGQLRLVLDGAQAGQALADWKTALANVKIPADFRNPFVKTQELRAWFDHAIERFQAAQDPEKTQAVAELYRKIAPGDEADERIARAAESLAQQLAAKHKAMLDNIQAEDVQAQYRRAGAAWEHAAQSRPAAQRADSFWRAAQCYLAARDSAHAQQVLQQFVKIEPNDRRLAEGWLALGDLYRHAGDQDSSHKAYHKCIEIPSTEFAHRARLHLAIAQKKQNNLVKAREILDQILTNQGPQLDRPTQEKALYQMTLVLMLMKNHGEARIHLKNFVQNFPENPNVLVARERLGECARQLAKFEFIEGDKLRSTIKVGMPLEVQQGVEERIRAHRSAGKALLKESANDYQRLVDELETKARSKNSLTDVEAMLLRRAWFGIGDCYYDDEEFTESLRIFTKLQESHRRTVEGLFAATRVCGLATLLRQPMTGLRSIRMLQEDLKAMPENDEVFRTADVPTREVWQRWSQDTERRLLTPPRKDTGPVFR